MVSKFNDVFFSFKPYCFWLEWHKIGLKKLLQKWRWLKISKEYRKDNIIKGYVYVEKISWFKKLSMAYNIGVANFDRACEI